MFISLRLVTVSHSLLGVRFDGIASVEVYQVNSTISGINSAYFCITLNTKQNYSRGLALGFHSNKVYFIKGGKESTDWVPII